MSFDNVCKYLAEQHPHSFVEWLLGIKETSIKVLKTELNVKPIHADSLLFLRVGKQILHLEFQTEAKSKPPLPLRMLDYSVRLKRKYGCEVIQIIIFLKKTQSEIVFQEEYRDKTTTHKYRVIRLWEEKPELFLTEPVLYPFAVLSQTDKPEELLGEIATKISEVENKELQPDLVTCTHILAGLRLEKRIIKSLLKEEIMRGSVTYQEIVKEAKIEAKIEGKIEEALNLVLRLVKQRFGIIDSSIEAKIQSLLIEDLEKLAIALLDLEYLGDLELWLEDNV